MKLKQEDGYYALASSGLGDFIRGSPRIIKLGKILGIIFVLILFFISAGLVFTFWKLPVVIGVVVWLVIWLGLPLILFGMIHKAVYGTYGIRGRPPKLIDLPKAEFHSLATCRGYGKRILNMLNELNVGDHYIFLLNFHNLFYGEEHRLENPDQSQLNVIGKAVRILPEGRKTSTWTKNPFHAIAGGLEAGKEASEKQQLDYIIKKLGALPEPAETRSIIGKEYLPRLLREFPRDVAMLISVVLCTANNYTAVFPYDERVVSEKDAIGVASNPTRENVVNYCLKFAGLSVEEPIQPKGLMED